MSEFEVLKKHQRLFHADVAIHLEAHVGHWITGIQKSDDVFCDHVQSWYLITKILSIFMYLKLAECRVNAQFFSNLEQVNDSHQNCN